MKTFAPEPAAPPPLGEFELIDRFFSRPGHRLPTQVVLGIGDDCALLQPTPGMQWAVSSDMLVCGRHFFPDVSPHSLGHKALAVNLSDLAACGATPVGFTLALSLPQSDAAWLDGFSRGLLELADAHHCSLVGGDTTRGPLTISITVFGEIPPGQALLRSGAVVSDDVWVSGTLGDAALALDCLNGHRNISAPALALARERLERPTPRIGLGTALRGIASSAADISDGLAGDLGHIVRRSGVGAVLDAHAVFSLFTPSHLKDPGSGGACDTSPSPDDVARYTLYGGDDYELVFTASPLQRTTLGAIASQTGTPLTRIGQIVIGDGIELVNSQGTPWKAHGRSFDHFAG
ncbi:MAG: thiamine-phosphate kinase [Rhodoferax sp.]|nr:thiamine-phosphate kinase [Rhodoferax sp.]